VEEGSDCQGGNESWTRLSQQARARKMGDSQSELVAMPELKVTEDSPYQEEIAIGRRGGEEAEEEGEAEEESAAVAPAVGGKRIQVWAARVGAERQAHPEQNASPSSVLLQLRSRPRCRISRFRGDGDGVQRRPAELHVSTLKTTHG